MDTGMVVVLVVVLVLVVGVNGYLLLTLRRGHPWVSRQLGLLKKVSRRARNPWESEDDDLKELSALVEKLKDKDK